MALRISDLAYKLGFRSKLRRELPSPKRFHNSPPAVPGASCTLPGPSYPAPVRLSGHSLLRPSVDARDSGTTQFRKNQEGAAVDCRRYALSRPATNDCAPCRFLLALASPNLSQLGRRRMRFIRVGSCQMVSQGAVVQLICFSPE